MAFVVLVNIKNFRNNILPSFTNLEEDYPTYLKNGVLAKLKVSINIFHWLDKFKSGSLQL